MRPDLPACVASLPPPLSLQAVSPHYPNLTVRDRPRLSHLKINSRPPPLQQLPVGLLRQPPDRLAHWFARPRQQGGFQWRRQEVVGGRARKWRWRSVRRAGGLRGRADASAPTMSRQVPAHKPGLRRPAEHAAGRRHHSRRVGGLFSAHTAGGWGERPPSPRTVGVHDQRARVGVDHGNIRAPATAQRYQPGAGPMASSGSLDLRRCAASGTQGLLPRQPAAGGGPSGQQRSGTPHLQASGCPHGAVRQGGRGMAGVVGTVSAPGRDKRLRSPCCDGHAKVGTVRRLCSLGYTGSRRAPPHGHGIGVRRGLGGALAAGSLPDAAAARAQGATASAPWWSAKCNGGTATEGAREGDTATSAGRRPFQA